MTLPKEVQKQIEIEATTYGGEMGYEVVSNYHNGNDLEKGYVMGATHYATQLHTLQQENELLTKKLKDAFTEIGRLVTERDKENERLRKALEEIVRVEDSRWTTQPDVKSRIWDIANAALTAQPEADK